MMSQSTIDDLNRTASADAAKLHRHPFVVEQGDIDKWKADLASRRTPTLPFPMLGNKDPQGWQADPGDGEGYGRGDFDSNGDLFVSKLAVFQKDGPAATLAELIGHLKPGKGYGLHSEGQFQVFVRQYRKADPPKPKTRRKPATKAQADEVRHLLGE